MRFLQEGAPFKLRLGGDFQKKLHFPFLLTPITILPSPTSHHKRIRVDAASEVPRRETAEAPD